MEFDRLCMELLRYGLSESDIDRDPRPSRLIAKRDAGRVVDARIRLEDDEDEVNRAGVQGEMKESGGPPPVKSKYPPLKQEPVGYRRRHEELRRRAYPEQFGAEAEQAKRAWQAREAMRQIGPAPVARVRVIRDEQGVRVVAVESEQQDQPAEP